MSTALSNDTTDEPRPNTITDFVGQKVYTSTGVYVGTVEDIRLNFDQQQATGLALTNVNSQVIGSQALTQSKGVVIPFRWVRAAHDVILILDLVSRLSSSTLTEE